MTQNDELGWIKLFRKIQDSFLWKDKPFTKGQAWTDLLLLANYADSGIWIRGIYVEVKRGQLAYPQGTLGKRWGWKRKKVSCFLKLLENEHQIAHQTSNLTTLITIVNYEQYQSKGQQTEHQRHTKGAHLKNKKNAKNKTDQINFEDELNRNRPERKIFR